jgi:hypothetical protein
MTITRPHTKLEPEPDEESDTLFPIVINIVASTTRVPCTPKVHHKSYTIDIKNLATQGVLTKLATKVAFVESRGMDKFNTTISSFDNSSDVSDEGKKIQDLCNKKKFLSPSMNFNFPKSSKNLKPQICNIVVL